LQIKMADNKKRTNLILVVWLGNQAVYAI